MKKTTLPHLMTLRPETFSQGEKGLTNKKKPLSLWERGDTLRKRVRETLFLAVLLCASTAFAEQLTLQQCVELAGKSNPQIIAARENVNIAAAKIGQVTSAAVPNVSLSGSLGKNYSQPVIPGLSPDKPADVTSYSLNVNQNLFVGGKIIQGISAARVSYDIAQQSLTKAETDVSCKVAEAYYNVLKAKKALEIVTESLASLQQHAKQAEVFARAGMATQADLLRAQAAQASMVVIKIQSAGGYDLSRLALNAAIGKPLPVNSDLADLNLTNFDPTPVLTVDAVAAAFTSRPDWLSYELGLKVANDAIVYSYGGYLPSLLYNYSSGRSRSEYEGGAGTYDLGNWRSMLVASWNIFDGFATPSRIKEAYAQLNSARAQEQGIRDGITLDVNSAVINLNTAREKLAASVIAETLSKKAMEYAEIAYRAQTATNLAYLDAMTAYHQSELSLWSARYDLELAKAKLTQAVGRQLL